MEQDFSSQRGEINPPAFPRGIEPRGKDLKTPLTPAARPHGIREGGGIKRFRAEEAVRRKHFKMILWIFFAVVVLGGITFAGIGYSRWRARNLPGQLIPDQGREHVGSDHQHVYNSNPPTSGWHFPQPAEWGVYKEELPDGVIIHNMEHGGVWISYKPTISEELRTKLEKFYERYGRKIIVTPREKNDTDVALAAWNRLDTFSAAEYSDERVDRFIKAFRNKGPEFVP